MFLNEENGELAGVDVLSDILKWAVSFVKLISITLKILIKFH